jgi:hypothetical protein
MCILFEKLEGKVSCHVGSTSIDFGVVFSRESTTTDFNLRSVVIDCQFASCHSCIGFKSSIAPLTSFIEKHFEVPVHLSLKKREDIGIEEVFEFIFSNPLGGEDDTVELSIKERDLAF